jgi:radical SAM protein with 4Fe4S-binding SPASM domain
MLSSKPGTEMVEKISINKNAKRMAKCDKNYPLVTNVPDNLMIEVTNACNLKCEMCENRHMKRKKSFMSFDMFKSIVDQARKLNIGNVGLYTTGESFLHPKIFDFIKYAKQAGFEYVYMTTNGQVLNDEKIKGIFESGLDSIKLSIDAVNGKKYESLKPGGNWVKLVEVIKKIRSIRDRLAAKLRIFGSFVVTNDNFDDLTEYNRIFGDLVDETRLSFIERRGFQICADRLFPKKLLPKIQKLMLPKEKWHPCDLLWDRIIVTCEGYLTACCVDFDNRLIYGNLNKETLDKCWNNEHIKKLRRIHKFREFEKLQMCDNCDAVTFQPYEVSDLLKTTR